jgi:glycosyltransferase involved in cell wall biosynthesis
MGLPVVTGNNPSMKEIVEKYGFGVSLDDDGSSVEKIVEGLNQVLSNYEVYHNNTLQHRKQLLWDNQEPVIMSIVEKLLG